MYEYLSGRLIRKSPTEVVVDVGGVGYIIRIPLSTYEVIPSHGDLQLLCHYQIREDTAQLYGFATAQERTLFRLLISVSRIGPAVAIGILSATSVAGLVRAIREADTRALESIKGIGKKMAQRLVVELKDPIEQITPQLLGASSDDSAAGRMEQDAALALTSLGYSRPAAQRAVEEARRITEAATVEELIKQALMLGSNPNLY